MLFKRFRVQCTLRVLVLGVSLALVVIVLLHTTYVVAALLLIGLVGYQLYALIRYVEQTNRRVKPRVRSLVYSFRL